MRALIAFTLLFFVGCSDNLPQKQCDPARRCDGDDAPVCGDDGRWYECALLADCEEVPVAVSESVCGERPDPPDNCPDIACDDCDGLIEHYGDDGCLASCECPDDPPECPLVDLNCETRIGPDGCHECIDDQCRIPTCDAAGCQLVYPRGGGCPSCVCEPICEPPDPACGTDPNCELRMGANGCETCVCEREGECDRLFCDNYCPRGYRLSADGCPTCECFEPCAALPECDLACPNGYQTDIATGCRTSCACLADACSPVACTIACQWGFRVGSDGCEQCECKGQPCSFDEECGLDERCVAPFSVTFDAAPIAPPEEFGECVRRPTCESDADCDTGVCGFYFRNDCCPPLTTCDANMPVCPAICLLDFGDLDPAP